jgi:hypothetical protein
MSPIITNTYGHENCQPQAWYDKALQKINAGNGRHQRQELPAKSNFSN